MTNVDRYDISQHEGDWAYMEQCSDGDWVRIESYQALESENARLRAGGEPVASISWTNDDPEWKLKMLAEPVHPPVVPLKLYTAPQPSAADAWKLAVDNVAGYAHLYNSGSGIIHEIRAEHARLLAAAPSAPLPSGMIR